MMGTRILALEARPSAAEIKSDVMSGVRRAPRAITNSRVITDPRIITDLRHERGAPRAVGHH
jgi:hypothetical protein